MEADLSELHSLALPPLLQGPGSGVADSQLHRAGPAVSPVCSPDSELPSAAVDADEHGDAGPAVHIELGDALAVPQEPGKPEFKRRSSALLVHAREKKGKIQLARLKRELDDERQSSRACMAAITTLLPGAGRLLGKQHVRHIARTRKAHLLKPKDFRLLCKAVHLRRRQAAGLGIRHTRLVCAAARLVLRRQQRGLNHVMQNARDASVSSGGDLAMHVTYDFMWDETRVKYRPPKQSDGHRTKKAGVFEQSIVKKGSFTFAMLKKSTDDLHLHREQWLCQPAQVLGTSAEALLPAVNRSQPVGFSLLDLDALRVSAQSTSSLTIRFLGDKASGNLSLMRMFGQHYEEEVVPKVGSNIMFWADSCCIHIHHRGKLQLKGVHVHTMRHFAAANLERLDDWQRGTAQRLDEIIAGRLKRKIGPPPMGEPTLRDYADYLFHLDDPHHQRGKMAQKFSSFWQDIDALCQVVNGKITDQELVHHCWDPQTQRPCCRNREQAVEKVQVACNHALTSRNAPLPAENTWTHVLSNFKQTLLRKGVCSIGLDCWSQGISVGNVDANIDVDGAASGDYFVKMNSVRAKRVMEYFGCPQSLQELGLFTVILDVYDRRLLHPMMAAAPDHVDLTKRDSKADLLVDPQETLIGKCMSELLDLLRRWKPAASWKRPWLILDVLGAPMAADDFKKFARSCVLRMASTVFRRYEVKFSVWPWLLFKMADSRQPQAERARVASKLLRSPRKELDTYSAGCRRLFNSKELLLSRQAEAMIRSDFSSFVMTTDEIERLNSYLQAGQALRGPSHSFIYSAREDLLRQATCQHIQRGGLAPLQAGLQRGRLSSQEELHVMPLLLSAVPGDIQVAGGPGADDPATVSSVVATRSCEDDLLPRLAHAVRTKPRGGSAFMLERNKHVAAAREAAGRVLTKDEVKNVHHNFGLFWDNMNQADRRQYIDAFGQWRKDWAKNGTAAATYQPMWGGGCHLSPLSAHELWEYQKAFGWPSNAVVDDPHGEESSAPVCNGEEAARLNRAAAFQLWGSGSMARNIDMSALADDPDKASIIEKGLFNHIVALTKEVADAGSVVFLLQGLSAGGAITNIVVQLVGTCYSPQVFEVARYIWERDENQAANPLHLPARCFLRIRDCRVSASYRCADINTSSEFVLEISNAYSAVELHDVKYMVPMVDDGLMCIEMHGATSVGILWEAGMTIPLAEQQAKQQRQRYAAAKAAMNKMQTADPMDPARAPMPASKKPRKHSSAAGGGGAGRPVQGAADVACASGHVDDIAPDLQEMDIRDGDSGCGDVAQAEHMDLADDEHQYLDPEEVLELDEAFAAKEVVLAPAAGVADDGGARVSDDVVAGAAAIVAEIEATRDIVCDTEILGPVEGADHDGARPPEPPPPPPPWEGLSPPSATGYVYDSNQAGRSVMRIQRAKPSPGSTQVSCYQHTGCTALFSTWRCPTDQPLYEWLFEVEGNVPGMSAAQRKALSKRHMAIGKASWTGPVPA